MAEDTYCPICYSIITSDDPTTIVWTDDPLKTPNHPIIELQGITIIRDRHITELQEHIQDIEFELYIYPFTEWTLCDTTTLPRYNHINELREAIEGILTKQGVDLKDWLSYDIDQQPVLNIEEWLDGHRLESKHILRGMHIEQLRKELICSWWERFNITIPAVIIDIINTVPPFPPLQTEYFIGDTGYWKATGYPSIDVPSFPLGFYTGEARLKIDTNSNKVNIYSLASVTSSPTQGWSDIEVNGEISAPVGRLEGRPLKPNTHVSFEMTITNTGEVIGGPFDGFVRRYVRFRLRLVGEDINYWYNIDTVSPPSTPQNIYLTKGEMENFNRNVYNDYVAAFGVPPPGAKVGSVYFALSNNLDTRLVVTTTLEVLLDNIKVFGQP